MSTDGSSDSLELRLTEGGCAYDTRILPYLRFCSETLHLRRTELRSGSAELHQSNGSESPGYKKPEGSRFVYQNRESLAHDLTFLAVMPELCDVTFLVGEERQPVCGVKAIMAARSW